MTHRLDMIKQSVKFHSMRFRSYKPNVLVRTYHLDMINPYVKFHEYIPYGLGVIKRARTLHGF